MGVGNILAGFTLLLVFTVGNSANMGHGLKDESADETTIFETTTTIPFSPTFTSPITLINTTSSTPVSPSAVSTPSPVINSTARIPSTNSGNESSTEASLPFTTSLTQPPTLTNTPSTFIPITNSTHSSSPVADSTQSSPSNFSTAQSLNQTTSTIPFTPSFTPPPTLANTSSPPTPTSPTDSTFVSVANSTHSSTTSPVDFLPSSTYPMTTLVGTVATNSTDNPANVTEGTTTTSVSSTENPIVQLKFTVANASALDVGSEDFQLKVAISLAASYNATSNTAARRKRSVSATNGEFNVTVLETSLDNQEVTADYTVQQSGRELTGTEAADLLRGSTDELLENLKIQNITASNITSTPRATTPETDTSDSGDDGSGVETTTQSILETTTFFDGSGDADTTTPIDSTTNEEVGSGTDGDIGNGTTTTEATTDFTTNVVESTTTAIGIEHIVQLRFTHNNTVTVTDEIIAQSLASTLDDISKGSGRKRRAATATAGDFDVTVLNSETDAATSEVEANFTVLENGTLLNASEVASRLERNTKLIESKFEEQSVTVNITLAPRAVEDEAISTVPSTTTETAVADTTTPDVSTTTGTPAPIVDPSDLSPYLMHLSFKYNEMFRLDSDSPSLEVLMADGLASSYDKFAPGNSRKKRAASSDESLSSVYNVTVYGVTAITTELDDVHGANYTVRENRKLLKTDVVATLLNLTDIGEKNAIEAVFIDIPGVSINISGITPVYAIGLDTTSATPTSGDVSTASPVESTAAIVPDTTIDTKSAAPTSSDVSTASPVESTATIPVTTIDTTAETSEVTTGAAAVAAVFPWWIIVIIVLGSICFLLLMIILAMCLRKSCGGATETKEYPAVVPPPVARYVTPPMSRTPTPPPLVFEKQVEQDVVDTGPEPKPGAAVPVSPAESQATYSEESEETPPPKRKPMMEGPPSMRMSHQPFVPRFRSTIHPIVLPPINAVVSRDIADSLTDGAMLRRRKSIERHKNKVRLRRRQPRRFGPYEDMQSQIDQVLAPPTPTVIRGPRKLRRGRDSFMLDGKEEDPEIAMLMGKRRDRPGRYNRDPESSSTDSGVTSPETTRRKMQKLLDDAFALIPPSGQKNLVGPIPPIQVQPAPMAPHNRVLMHHPDGRTAMPHHRVITPAGSSLSPSSPDDMFFTRRQPPVPQVFRPPNGHIPTAGQTGSARPSTAVPAYQTPMTGDDADSPVWTPYRTHDALSRIQAQGNTNYNNSNHAGNFSPTTSSPIPGSISGPENLNGTYIPPPNGFQIPSAQPPLNSTMATEPISVQSTSQPSASLIQSVRDELSRLTGGSTPVEDLTQSDSKNGRSKKDS